MFGNGLIILIFKEKKMDEGKKKFFLKNFGFLIDEYKMDFLFQKFHDYKGFFGPIYTYSFYNSNGCITFHNIAQRGEWGWYKSSKISNNQYELLEKEINQKIYLKKTYLLISNSLKDLANVLKKEINDRNTIFGIKVK
jgi:hypothetical protein